MEIIFLVVGLIFAAVGVAIIVAEMRARSGTLPVAARVIGFSTGRSMRRDTPSFHSIAEYVAPGGRTYYVEGAIGSSAPLHAVGDSVTVLVNPAQPEDTLLKSGLSYILGIGIMMMGLASVGAFWFTFHANLYSLGMAAVMILALAFKIKQIWRKEPLSLSAWRTYKKQIFSPRVFTDQTKDQISWAEPPSLTVAIENYEKTQRFGAPVLLVIGFVLLFLGHHFYVKTHAFLENASRALGVVVDLKENNPNDSSSSTYAAVVDYTDSEERKHRFVDSFSSSPPTYDHGQTVSVLYDREDPANARIDLGRANYWPAYLCYFLGGLFVLLAAFSARRRPLRGPAKS